MTTAFARAGAVVFSALAMLSLLLGAAAIALGRPDRTAAYLAFTVLCIAIVAVLMRRDVRRRRALEAQLPPEARPARRKPRRAIVFPLRESAVTFVLWYVAAVGIDRFVTQATTFFTLAVVAPFAAFMLTSLTVAGRHMAFRLTAEEAAEQRPVEDR